MIAPKNINESSGIDENFLISIALTIRAALLENVFSGRHSANLWGIIARMQLNHRTMGQQ